MNLPNITLIEATLWIGGMVIAWSLYRAHRNPEYKNFNFFDLLIDNGRLSRIAVVFMGTWVVTSAVIWKLMIDGKMNEGYFTAYCAAWITPIIAKLYSQPASTTVVSQSSSLEITQEKK
jgi:hypothetical protein